MLPLFLATAIGCSAASATKVAVGTKPATSPAVKLAPKESAPASAGLQPIVDSSLTLAEALRGSKAPSSILAQQTLVNVRYYSFDHKLHQGQVLIAKPLAGDIKAIFSEIEASKFPIGKVVPVSKYGWSDDASVAADNTSAFNYRSIPETRLLSHHALGRAIDVNPLQNPYEDPRRHRGLRYDPGTPGAITREGPVAQAFRRRGWFWGGLWRRDRDYQHFEKLL